MTGRKFGWAAQPPNAEPTAHGTAAEAAVTPPNMSDKSQPGTRGTLVC
jgi:hypothetical protein